ncbi:MAG: excinuclease ABC subunit A [Desulfobacteraceae bacterium]|nr:MAG: excinuclease ABC subunit A [Desulfobacteraceae bacterium]
MKTKDKNRAIVIKGAREHNLKGLDLDIPLNRITVITGVSGSGKSSLAFDTLYAEGQRRYVETFSPYARQFLERMDRPKADRIEGIPPGIAIDRKDPVRTSRSTVGTMTEITDYVKLLFATAGRLHCGRCGKEVMPEGPDDVWRAIAAHEGDGEELLITFPFTLEEGKISQSLLSLAQQGFTRHLKDWRLEMLDEIEGRKERGKTINVVMDRLPKGDRDRKRIMDSIEQAFLHGKGRMDLWMKPDYKRSFSSRMECPNCMIAYYPPSPNLFSFNSPIGACPSCRGFGRIIDVDLDLVIPNRSLSLEQGAIKPWGGRQDKRMEYGDLLEFCRKEGIPLSVPYETLTDNQRRRIEEGTSTYYGIRGFFRWLETKTYKMHVRVYLSRYRSYAECPGCGGTRFKDEALLYRIGGLTIAQLYGMNVKKAREFINSLDFKETNEALRLITLEIENRLRFLDDVGLGYLTLDRQSRTLSGGEVARVAMAAALGSSMVDSLYVLDEPSIGLHPRDTDRLTGILRGIRDLPNTVVAVEHDPFIIAGADHVVDLGPGAGTAGGQLMYQGHPSQMTDSLTGGYLKGRLKIPVPENRKSPQPGRWLIVKGASENNLKSVEIRIPIGLFVCITGVSGSGKSTLAEEILYKAIKRAKGDNQGKPGAYGSMEGLEFLEDACMVDQRPIGRTPRANLLTYTGAMTHIRTVLAGTPDARANGISVSDFSFNSGTGRCPVCKGEGFQTLEMQFLSDVSIACPECNGTRFQKHILEVTFQGKNIQDILSMTVDEAVQFFADKPPVIKCLTGVQAVGLGYITLGQPLSTLSSGEAQRLKLSRHLVEKKGGRRLFIFDEPTTGLHLEDTAKLLSALFALRDKGNTVLVIEHNMEVVKTSDWVVDLGPEGGEAGGEVVAWGPPQEAALSDRSLTAPFLRNALEGKEWVMPHGSLKPARVCEDAEGGWSRPDEIAINGAREHNLKNLTLSIPRKQLVVITGVSGSGKSSLAFDILFAEGQRRYLETLAPYVRQYMRILQRPDVDSVSGIPPTVAIEQRISHASRRSTVGTLTEIYHFLRLFFSKLGTPHCPKCGRSLEAGDRDAIISMILERHGKEDALILVPKLAGRKGFQKKLIMDALKKNITEARIDGKIISLEKGMALSRHAEHTIDLIMGRLASTDPKGLLEMSLQEGEGTVLVMRDERSDEIYSITGTCPQCGIGVPEPDPRLFSFNTSRGACHECKGTGTVGEEYDRTCPSCNGSRLKKEAMAVTVSGMSIWDMVSIPAVDLLASLRRLLLSRQAESIAAPLIAEIAVRLSLMEKLGISYLELSRSGDTLSGGEAQRVRLSAQLGSNLTGACYVLDEPTIGLHPRDGKALISALEELRDRGNSVVVVEHDEETIRRADHIIDIGPGAGASGGRLVGSGNPYRIAAISESVTGRYLDGKPRVITSRLRPYREASQIFVHGASLHNLKNIDAAFPLGCLICVTGVSGSGKSTLLKDVLYRGIASCLAGNPQEPSGCRALEGWSDLKRIVEVDHSPIGRTTRSVPSSYVGFLSRVRELFSMVPESRSRGYKPGRFSFNVSDGRCEACKGHGSVKVSMGFLPDVYVNCETCNGKRFNPDTLAIKYRGKNISEIMEMTFEQCAAFFASVPEIRRAADFVSSIGLGYLRLGQPSPTLSGGEAQRIKLAEELSRKTTGHTFYILDEPTTGLHMSDVERLISVLQDLVERGNTVAVIEHNMAIIKEADYIIDLGPEGGKGGGRITAAGSPIELVKTEGQSHTARFLKTYLGT